MSLVDILAPDKEKNIIKKEEGLIPSVGYYYSNNYSQLYYDLKYAKDEEIFNNDTIHIYARRYHNSLFKFILTESLKDLSNFDFSNQNLVNYAKNRALDNLQMSDFDLKTITIIIIKDENEHIELIKKYCFLNSYQDKNNYQMVFRFDEKNHCIKYYKLLKDFGKLYNLYNTAIRFDLAQSGNGDEE